MKARTRRRFPIRPDVSHLLAFLQLLGKFLGQVAHLVRLGSNDGKVDWVAASWETSRARQIAQLTCFLETTSLGLSESSHAFR
jgi:hypothetical protein